MAVSGLSAAWHDDDRRAAVVDQGAPVDEAIVAVRSSTGVNLVVTLGARGAVICNQDDRVTHVAAPAVAAVDTTGASDAFVGAFAYALARGLAPAAAADLGCRCAALSVTRAGTQASFPSAEESTRIRGQAR